MFILHVEPSLCFVLSLYITKRGSTYGLYMRDAKIIRKYGSVRRKQ